MQENKQQIFGESKQIVAVLDNLNTRFSGSEWSLIEQISSSNYEKLIINCLSNYFGNNNENSDYYDKYTVIGDELYNYIRETRLKKTKYGLIVNDEIYEQTKEKKKGNGNKKNKDKKTKEDIIIENTKEKLNKKIDDLLKSFDNLNYQSDYGLNNDIVEFKGITLMFRAWSVLNGKNVNPYEFLNLEIGIQKFVNKMKDYKCKTLLNSQLKAPMSQLLLNDLVSWLKLLFAKIPLSGIKIYDLAPQLLIYSDYDKYIPYSNIEPREHQIELIDTIKKHKDKFLISYNAMIGSGKTTMAAVGLSSYVKMLRREEKYKKLQLIICCNIPSVRYQTANLAFEAGIEFGIAVIEDDKLIIRNHFNCHNHDEDRVLIICGHEAANRLIENDNKANRRIIGTNEAIKDTIFNNYILFIDEPTIDADRVNSFILKSNMKLLLNLPDKTILSSATLPKLEKFAEFVNYHKEKYPNIPIHTIHAKEIQIGCHVETFNGETITPHCICTDVNELKKTIDKINSNLMLGKFYTPDTAYEIWRQLGKFGVTMEPTIDELFSDINNLSANNVKKYCLEMLNKLLAINDNELIKNICCKDDSNDHDDSGDNIIDFNHLGTSSAHNFDKMTLIATDNPCSWSMNAFRELIDDVKKDINIVNLISDYNKKKKLVMEKVAEKERINELKIEKMNKKRKDDRVDIKNMHIKRPEDDDEYDLTLQIPARYQINTFSHFNHYNKGLVVSDELKEKIAMRQFRELNDLGGIELDFRIPEDILILLFCGVGIYSVGNSLLDQKYSEYVLKLASNNKLVYLVADSSICYGTNYSIGTVIVTDNFMNNHSMNTIFQLIGRAGRVGKSWKANAFVPDEFKLMLQDYIIHESEDIELYNMSETFIKLIDTEKEKTEKEAMKKQKLKELTEKIRKFEEDRIEFYNFLEREKQKKNEIEKKKERSVKMEKIRKNNSWLKK